MNEQVVIFENISEYVAAPRVYQETYHHVVASELNDPICHSDECQIGSFSFEATMCGRYQVLSASPPERYVVGIGVNWWDPSTCRIVSLVRLSPK